MAAPDDDRFVAGDAPITVADALARLSHRIKPVTGTRTVALIRAMGRYLAEDVVADRDVPPHDNSAVDGYAVRFADLDPAAEIRLAVAGRVAAGHHLEGVPAPGQAVQIFTGGAMPDGLDTVVMVEDCRREGSDVVVPAGVRQGANRRRAGEDVRAGRLILRNGRRLRAQDVALAASVGRARVKVHDPLRAAVFSTGDEIRDPAAGAVAGCIYDANRYAIMALLTGLGCRVTDLGILADSHETVRDALAAAASGHDLLVTSGGVSTGEEDHVRAAVAALGRLHFWRLAVKPGRPMAFGQVGRSAFVGLPGNPVAAMVCFMRIARPLVILLAGGSEIAPAVFRVRAGFDFRSKKPGRREWLRVRLVAGDDGAPIALKFPAEGSGILTSMVESDGLVELAEDAGPVTEGAWVDFLPFSEVTR